MQVLLRSIPNTLLVLLIGLNHAFAQNVDNGNINAEVVVDQVGDYIVTVSGLSNRQLESLRLLPRHDFVKLWVDGIDRKTIPPLVGNIGFTGTNFYFKPDFPFKPGMKYQSEIIVPLESKVVLNHSWTIPAGEVKPTTITAVYPSARRLPENLLKFYVHFSGSMRKGDVYQFIRVRERIEENGEIVFREIELPFLEIEQEFWSPDSKRLTLLFDPGRIKRGLKPREEMGPIFEANRIYELVIDGQWPDANGKPLQAALSSSSGLKSLSTIFEVTGADQTRPNPKNWRIKSPIVDSNEPLVLRLDESLDSAMLRRVINVFDQDDQLVEGEVELVNNEAVWKFSPDKVWTKGIYEIRIDNRLEDLCGNSISKLFDVDVLENKPTGSDGETTLKFPVR